MATMTDMIRYIQRRLGAPRFDFMNPEEIQMVIVEDALPEFDHYFPYKSYFPIYPNEDAVDEQNYPGLFKIMPKDCAPEKIYDVGMIFSSSDMAIGGYSRDLGRTVYGGQTSIGALMYNQLNVNLMSMSQPQQLTCEFIQPNMVQCYPKRRFYSSSTPLIIELMVGHADNLSTIPNSYNLFFRTLCEYTCKRYIYDKYRDLDDETYAGHQIRAKIDGYSDAESKIEEWREKAHEESFKNPDRLDLFFV